MANKKNRPVPPKKKKTEKRVIWVRVMAILLALLLAGSRAGRYLHHDSRIKL